VLRIDGVINVKQFGAVGDGVADDYLPIHKANIYVKSKGGGVIYYPEGTYLISRAIRLDSFDYVTDSYLGAIPTGITHQGAGAEATTIRTTSYNSGFTSFPEPYVASIDVPAGARGTDLAIYDMTIDCDYNSNPDYGTATYSDATFKYEVAKLGGTWKNGSATPAVAVYSSDNYQYPIYTNRNERFRVERCIIKESWYNGIELYKSSSVHILSNYIFRCGDKENVFGFYTGVEPDNACADVWIVGNEFEDCGNGVISNGDPMAYATGPVTRVHVLDNNFVNITRSGVFAFAWIQSWNIRGNTFEGIGRSPIYIFEDNRVGKEPNRHPDRCNITSNTIKSFNTENVDSTGIRYEGITGNISDNIIIDRDVSTTANTRAILVSDTNIDIGTYENFQVNVSNNVIQGRFPTDTNSGIVQIQQPNANVTGNSITALDSVAEVPFIITEANATLSDNKVSGLFNHNRPYKFTGSGDGTISEVEYRPFFEANTTATQTTLGAQYYTIDWDSWGTVVIDTLNMYDTVNKQLDTPYNGYYQVTLIAKFQNVGSAGVPKDFIIALEVGGAVVDQVRGSAEGELIYEQVTTKIPLSALNTVKARVFSSDGNWNLLSGTRMTFEYLGNFKQFGV
tara:strand:- start:64 stop:1932 length:1869 start_codon:yes stop_codon:yes gene_type:complete